MADVNAALTAQGLEASDLEANKAGRVTDKQIERQKVVRFRGGLGVWLIVAAAVVGGPGYGWLKSTQTGDKGIFVFGIILGVVLAAIPLTVYYVFRFVDPEKLREAKVTRIDGAEIKGLLTSRRRGVYTVNLDGKLYSGFARDLTRAHLGARVNAYVVAEHKIVLALEPIG